MIAAFQRRPLAMSLAALAAVLAVIVAVELAAGGGLYLWYHQSIAAIRCHESDCRTAQKRLVGLPGKAAIGLIIGYDYRVGDGTQRQLAKRG